MRIAIIGAAGRTGIHLVRQALERGHQVSAVCRPSSAPRIGQFTGREECDLYTGDVVPDEALLTRALKGCEAVVAIKISVGELRATTLVRSLDQAMAAANCKRCVFTAFESAGGLDPGEKFSLRQKIMRFALPPFLQVFTPSAPYDMVRAAKLIREQSWDWTIVRAPTLHDGEARGYRRCELGDLEAIDKLSRADYAAALLDAVEDGSTLRQAISVT